MGDDIDEEFEEAIPPKPDGMDQLPSAVKTLLSSLD